MFHPYLTPNPTPLFDGKPYQPRERMLSTHSSSGQGNKRARTQRSEKDIRHCDAEKARRDHQITYIDMCSSLRNRFRWPEELEASSSSSRTNSLSHDITPGSSSNPSTAESSAGDGKAEKEAGPSPNKAETGGGTGKRTEKMTKQNKLHQQVLWEFRTCLRFDVEKVREWLDEVRGKGEELRRVKREVLEGRGPRETGAFGVTAAGGHRRRGRKNEMRSVKDEAVLEVCEIMEREFWRFCDEGGIAGIAFLDEDGGPGKRRKLVDYDDDDGGGGGDAEADADAGADANADTGGEGLYPGLQIADGRQAGI